MTLEEGLLTVVGEGSTDAGVGTVETGVGTAFGLPPVAPGGSLVSFAEAAAIGMEIVELVSTEISSLEATGGLGIV